jgi:hypothetical protein
VRHDALAPKTEGRGAAESALGLEDQAQETTEALIEGVAKEAELAETIRAAVGNPEKEPDFQLSVSTGERHVPEMRASRRVWIPLPALPATIVTGLGLAPCGAA